MNLVNFLNEMSLMHGLKFTIPYMVEYIYEFYANLKPSVGKLNFRNYGNVRFRGNSIMINPRLINLKLRTGIMKDPMVEDMNEVITVFTGSQLMDWEQRLNALKLTSLYSVLHKIVIYNWLSSSNTTTLAA